MDEDMTSDDVCAEGFVNLQNCGCLSGQPNNYRVQLYLPVTKAGQQPQGGSGGELRFATQYYWWFDVEAIKFKWNNACIYFEWKELQMLSNILILCIQIESNLCQVWHSII